MAKIEIIDNIWPDRRYVFDCPGCGCGHWFKTTGERPCWTFNGDMERPTVSPSILVTVDRSKMGLSNRVCHSFVRDGNIQFLGDCTHALAGQTVALPDVE